MQLSDYTYDLPTQRIAIRPPDVRGSTRLLVIDRQTGECNDDTYAHIAHYLRPGDLVVINTTKVIHARLQAQTESGATRELLLLEKHGSREADPHAVRAMYRRRIHVGQPLYIGSVTLLVAELYGNGTALITSEADIFALAETNGSVPLPPYLHRDADENDVARYQTVFAKEAGSVAAPTASLNLTHEILDSIRAAGASVAEITLHVGLGTFMPIREADITKHEMHAEYFQIPPLTIAAIREAKAEGRRVIAIGTTVTRTLEHAAENLLAGAAEISGEANIFIYPGYTFKIVDAMLTNFHAPGSTVLMMAAAFAGWDHLKNAYDYAVRQKYDFLSYGDSTFIQ
jgi:S-adenosylmethionine:tRNA ribosyltransferase-isomerase